MAGTGLGLGAWLHAGTPGCSRRGGLPVVLRKEAERCTRCRRRGWRRSSEALRRRCRRPALCGPLAGILLLVTARHGDPRRRVPPRRRRDPQLRRQVRFGWAGTQDGASQAWNLQLRSPETGTHAYGTYWRGPTLTVRGPTVAIPPLVPLPLDLEDQGDEALHRKLVPVGHGARRAAALQLRGPALNRGPLALQK